MGGRIWLAVVVLILSPGTLALPESSASELELGVRQVKEGDFGRGILTLEETIRSLPESRRRDRARAYVYVSVAYLGLEQREMAKVKLAEAWKCDPDFPLNREGLAPEVLVFLREARKHAVRQAPTPARDDGAGRSRETAILAGAGAVAVAGFALAASTGDETSPVDPETLDDDGDGFTEQQGDCNDEDPGVYPGGDVTATPMRVSIADETVLCQTVAHHDGVVVSNRSCNDLSVGPVHVTKRLVWERGGSCGPEVVFHLPTNISIVPAGASASIIDHDRSLHGCCHRDCGKRCHFEETYMLETSQGGIELGSIRYTELFRDCPCTYP